MEVDALWLDISESVIEHLSEGLLRVPLSLADEKREVIGPLLLKTYWPIVARAVNSELAGRSV